MTGSFADSSGLGGFVYATARLLHPRIRRNDLSRSALSEAFIARELPESFHAAAPPAAAWRAIRPAVGLHANLPYLIDGVPLSVLDGSPRRATGQGFIKRARLYGAMRREILVWRGVILVEFSWTRLFEIDNAIHDKQEYARAQWRALSRHGATLQLNRREASAAPEHQALLLASSEQALQSGEESESDIRFRRLRDFTGRSARSSMAQASSQKSGARDRSAVTALAYLSEEALPGGVMQLRPVKTRSDRHASDAANTALGAAVPTGSLTASRMAQFARAFSHVLAHEALIAQAQRLATDFSGPMTEAADWTFKQNAAGRFLMNWQQFINLFQSEWALGSGDPYAHPGDVSEIDRALGASATWTAAVSNIAALSTLASEVLPDGDSSVLL